MFVIMFFRHQATSSRSSRFPNIILYPGIIMMCVVGAYAINFGIMFDVWTLLFFGLFGYLGQKVGLEIAPFIIGFILGNQAEVYFVKSLESFGDLSIFFTKSPIAIGLWVLIILSLGYSIYGQFKMRAASKKG
ncbi:tripartite tricarboxylate transporter permease [uncultured Cohaesibacter sp.]|uniref:tripartite tricarboxylate transporter permease n=1 Tax=uncultured Cohaesibacter sp. TaxID=1002546 RepID=UPI0029C927B4|nr:tripartite tricarboxylate transporter permease [uncultured Cohaesibacter sp.]